MSPPQVGLGSSFCELKRVARFPVMARCSIQEPAKALKLAAAKRGTPVQFENTPRLPKEVNEEFENTHEHAIAQTECERGLRLAICWVRANSLHYESPAVRRGVGPCMRGSAAGAGSSNKLPPVVFLRRRGPEWVISRADH